MKQKLLTFLMLLNILVSQSVFAERCRPKIVNNVLVTDQGTLLRGRPLDFKSGWPAYTLDSKYWQDTRNRNINCIRLIVRVGQATTADIDKCVEIAAQLGMYLILDCHYFRDATEQNVTDFWKLYAPRYKDRTHVIYELANETWNPGYDAQAKTWSRIYKVARDLAPNTHIIILSTPGVPGPGSVAAVDNYVKALMGKSIDFTKTIVGYHYYSNTGNLTSLFAAYPVICTEYFLEASFIETHEKKGISWVAWERTKAGDTDEKPGTWLPDFDLAYNQLKAKNITWGPDNWSFTCNSSSTVTLSISNPVNGVHLKTDTTITIQASASSTSGTITKVEFFNGTTKLGEDFSSPYTYTWATIPAGSYTIKAVATDSNGETANDQKSITVGTVFVDVFYPIPGKVEAENYVDMQGIQLETTTDVGGGKNVGYLAVGDWINYNLDVEKTSTYAFNFRVASTKTTGKFEIIVDNVTLATVNVPNTGGWQTYTNVIVNVKLNQGEQVMRLNIIGSDLNINWFDATKLISKNEDIKQSIMRFYPNPFSSEINITNSEDAIVKIVNVNGVEVFQSIVSSSYEKIDLSRLNKGVYFIFLSNKTQSIVNKIIKK